MVDVGIFMAGLIVGLGGGYLALAIQLAQIKGQLSTVLTLCDRVQLLEAGHVQLRSDVEVIRDRVDQVRANGCGRTN